jgi:TRAP-type C4-dicarboxylate transport system permease small subunit
MDCAMHTNVADTARKRLPKIPASVWFGGLAVRTIFLGLLIVLTARVASPQIEKISSVLETPGDLVRVALGFAVCVWLVVNLFILPKDAGEYRTWLYLGVAILPLSLLCAIVVW